MQIASIYRNLRKAREDSKDEPGAADFYYGEMEMRLRSTEVPLAERSILFLYWLTAGYGLRAWRAFAALVFLILLTTLLLDATGLEQVVTAGVASAGASAAVSATAEPTLADALVHAFEVVAPGVEPDLRPSTRSGRVLQVIFQLVAAVLAVEAALAIRNRVKR